MPTSALAQSINMLVRPKLADDGQTLVDVNQAWPQIWQRGVIVVEVGKILAKRDRCLQGSDSLTKHGPKLRT